MDIAELKARHPLGDAVEAAGVALRGKGRVRQGVCPFHEEAEGSFTVYADAEKFYCFGCGSGGDVLDFVQRDGGANPARGRYGGWTAVLRRLRPLRFVRWRPRHQLLPRFLPAIRRC